MEPIIVDASVLQDMKSEPFWRASIGYTLKQKQEDRHPIFHRDESGQLLEIDYASPTLLELLSS